MNVDTAPRTAAAACPGLERGHGRAEIRFARSGADRTVVSDLYQRSPCRVLLPRPEAGDPVTAVLVTTSGGLTGGDTMEFAAVGGAGTRALLTTQAAEKIYRAAEGDCRVNMGFSSLHGAWMEWVPQETILFDGARLRRRTEVDIAGDGRFLACDMLVFGRRARGERFTHGRLRDSWRVHRDGRLLWADDLHLDGDIEAKIDHPAGFAAAAAYATIVYAGEDSAEKLAPIRASVDKSAVRGGVSLVNGVILIRLLGGDPAVLRTEVARLCIFLRFLLAGLPARMPRVWTI